MKPANAHELLETLKTQITGDHRRFRAEFEQLVKTMDLVTACITTPGSVSVNDIYERLGMLEHGCERFRRVLAGLE